MALAGRRRFRDDAVVEIELQPPDGVPAGEKQR